MAATNKSKISKPWQVELANELEEIDPCKVENGHANYKVIWIVDYFGNSGKEDFKMYMKKQGASIANTMYEIHKAGKKFSAINICGIETTNNARTLILDLGEYDRTELTKIEKENKIYTMLNHLKDGTYVFYDNEEKYNEMRIDSPHIVVFSKVIPELYAYSQARWDIRIMDQDGESIYENLRYNTLNPYYAFNRETDEYYNNCDSKILKRVLDRDKTINIMYPENKFLDNNINSFGLIKPLGFSFMNQISSVRS